MSSDVDMNGAADQPAGGPAPRRPSPPHHAPIDIDDSDDSRLPLDPGSVSSASSVPDAVHPKSLSATKENGKTHKPSSGAAAPNPPPGAKPRSTKQPRSPSPSPPPPPAPPPVQTIRLEIKLGGQDNYAVDIGALSKETGQRPSTPVPLLKRDTSDDSHSEGDDEGDDKLQTKKKRKRRNPAAEYYDVSDPFIDDSELTKDERTFFAETKQQGFYVSSGQVALQHNAPQTKKPKSRKVNILAPAASVSAALATLPASLAPLSLNGASASTSKVLPASPRKVSTLKDEGTKDAPITLLEDDKDDKNSASGLKRKASEADSVANLNGTSSASVASTSKKKRRIEIRPFHPDLQVVIDQLKHSIAQESFEQKGKFPQNLKPALAQLALKAIVLGEYDDNFFNLMPTLFPYNKFTMTKLIKRTIWREHTNLLLDRQQACLQDLTKLADEGFPKAQDEYEKSLIAWEKRQEKSKQDDAGPSVALPPPSAEGTPVPSDTHPTPTTGSTNLPSRDDGGGHESGHEDDGAGQGGGQKGGKDAHPPMKKYRLTEDMRALIWQLVCLSNECCRIENEKNLLEQNNQVVSEQGVRKTLYQKIVAAFPDGWLSSGQISRDVSVMKKKYEKDSMEE